MLHFAHVSIQAAIQVNEDFKQMIKDLGYLSTIGMAMAFSIAMGALLGYYLDKKLGTQPWLFFVCLGFGIAAAFRNLYIFYKKAKKM